MKSCLLALSWTDAYTHRLFWEPVVGSFPAMTISHRPSYDPTGFFVRQFLQDKKSLRLIIFHRVQFEFALPSGWNEAPTGVTRWGYLPSKFLATPGIMIKDLKPFILVRALRWPGQGWCGEGLDFFSVRLHNFCLLKHRKLTPAATALLNKFTVRDCACLQENCLYPQKKSEWLGLTMRLNWNHLLWGVLRHKHGNLWGCCSP